MPLVAISAPPASLRIAITVVVVLAGLVATGVASARLGQAPPLRAAVRNVVGGAVAMAVTYGIGTVIGTTGL